MNILIDSWCSQVLYQQTAPWYPKGVSPGNGAPTPTGSRLNTLLGAIASIGQSGTPWNVAFTQTYISSSSLAGIDVYVSLTRYQGKGFAYQEDELEAIETWVQGGGSILLMTNHGGFPSNPGDNWTKNDKALAKLFQISLEDYSVADWSGGGTAPSVIEIENTVPYLATQAPAITAHDACIIMPASGVPIQAIAVFPSAWTAYDPKTQQYGTPTTPYFAVQAPYTQNGAPVNGAGSLIVIGNSGWPADYGSPMPAPGLAPFESNLLFALNCIGYLGNFTMPSLGG